MESKPKLNFITSRQTREKIWFNVNNAQRIKGRNEIGVSAKVNIYSKVWNTYVRRMQTGKLAPDEKLMCGRQQVAIVSRIFYTHPENNTNYSIC